LAVQDELDAGHVSQAFEALRSRIRKALAEKLSGPGVPTAPTVLAHNAFTFHKNLALTAALADLAREGRARFIAWCHDLAWTNPLYLSMLHDGMPWDLLRTPCPGVTYVAISRERQRELTGLFGWPTEKVGCVPNGIDATRFLSASDTMRLLLKRLDWHGRDMVLLAPARMTPRKNLEMAIGVVAELKATGQYPLLVVTGPPDPHSSGQDYAGFLREECRRLRVEEDVCFLSQVLWLPGGVSDELMAELYRWADALIFPSRQEGFGLPILEGGLARLPIFCSDLPVLREIGGEDAHYFSPDSPPASVAALIHAALTAPGPAALRRRVLEEYGWEAIYREQLEPLLSKGGTVYGKHIIVA
jgi:glycosyltransferase involved in cell wall biosynthesis